MHAGIPPPRDQAPPCAVHAGRYGQQAGGMHPTGMQSCSHCRGMGPGPVQGTDTIENNASSSLFLSQTSVDISIWYYTFHLFPVPVLVPFTCSVNIPCSSLPKTEYFPHGHGTWTPTVQGPYLMQSPPPPRDILQPPLKTFSNLFT